MGGAGAIEELALGLAEFWPIFKRFVCKATHLAPKFEKMENSLKFKLNSLKLSKIFKKFSNIFVFDNRKMYNQVAIFSG